MFLSKLNRAIKNPREVGLMLVNFLAPIITNDKVFLSLKYRVIFGKKLNWETPKTFSEKLQWLKVYDRNPQYTVLVDKIKVKEYVAEKLGEEFIIPTLGTWEHPEDIDFASLPEKFVLKCNHNSGLGMYICKDKSKMDKEAVIRELNKGLKEDYYKLGREWPYKNVPRRILAEKFIETEPNVKDLPDYKWYCFDGEPKYCQLITNNTTQESIGFYDTGWSRLTFNEKDDVSPHDLQNCPIDLEDQLRVVRELQKKETNACVDLFHIGKKTYFGEITHFSTSEFGELRESDYKIIHEKMNTLPGDKSGGMICVIKQDSTINISRPDFPDYKFFCFDGKVKAMFVATERQFKGEEVKFDFFDDNYNYLPFRQGHDHAKVAPPKPSCFDDMKRAAEKLSKGFPHARVDFYEINGHILFGEMTFFHFSGLVPFEPEKWDEQFGKWLTLP